MSSAHAIYCLICSKLFHSNYLLCSLPQWTAPTLHTHAKHQASDLYVLSSIMWPALQLTAGTLYQTHKLEQHQVSNQPWLHITTFTFTPWYSLLHPYPQWTCITWTIKHTIWFPLLTLSEHLIMLTELQATSEPSGLYSSNMPPLCQQN
jgi:hypothetical protein